MKRVSEFYKVSFKQFDKDYREMVDKNIDHVELKRIYDSIKLPTRATECSAGYDFFLPYAITLKAGEETTIPSGIRCKFKKNYGLFIMSKSGLGTRNRLQINTCISLIDSDYFYCENEGHMSFRIIHDSRDPKAVLSLPAGKSFLQGIFFPYGVTHSDNAKEKRKGGFGSTN